MPRPTHSDTLPPRSAAEIAAEDVVFPIPISPRTNKSLSLADTASRPQLRASRKRVSVIADSNRISPVGRPIPTSTAFTVAPDIRANALTVDNPDSNADIIASVTDEG